MLAIDLRAWFLADGIPILAIIAVAAVITIGLRIPVARFRRRLEGADSVTAAINLQRGTTLAHALTTAITVAVWSIAVLLVLDRLGVNL
ncbi:MAG: hypothetical protein ACKO8G_03585, partial [Actinomycetota bacterium]